MKLIKAVILNIMAMLGTMFTVGIPMMFIMGEPWMQEYKTPVQLFLFIFPIIFILYIGTTYCDTDCAEIEKEKEREARK